MERVIKFKIWDLRRKEFFKPIYRAFEGDLYDLSITTHGQISLRTIECASDMRNQDFIKLQFINSNDADGKEIYEGDILQAPAGNMFEVKWHDEELRWAMYRLDTWYNMNCRILRIVGNVYENPELLKSA